MTNGSRECSNACGGCEESVKDELPAEDSIVCYCYRLTTRQLKESYKKHGNLKGVEDETRAGLGCTGCKVLLYSLFNEMPSGQMDAYAPPLAGSSCARPGRKTMKGFIIANDEMDSTVVSSNAVAPQLGECDTTTVFEYALVDHNGVPVTMGTRTVKTDETFTFDTRTENIPRPFYGMFLLTFGRENNGASRFNIYWSNKKGTTCTHENGASGKPRTFIPILVNRSFLKSENNVYLALMNPYTQNIKLNLTAYDPETNDQFSWNSELNAYCSTWVDVNENVYQPALEKFPTGKFVLRVETVGLDMHHAVSSYFFVHNKKADLWTSNHI